MMFLIKQIGNLPENDKYSILEGHLEHIVVVLCNTQCDNDSKVIKLSSKAIIEICQTIPLSMHSYLDKLVSSIVKNAKHRMYEVRCCSIDSLRELIPLGSDSLIQVMNKYVIECMDKLAEDEKPKVRIV